MLALRTLEFDRIVDAVTALALTPLGAAALSELEPSTDPKAVVAQQDATTETVKFLDRHPLFPLRAGEALPAALEGLEVQGRPLEPLQLRLLADFVDSVDQARASIGRAGADFPILRDLVANVASFKAEVDAVRHAIDPGGDVLDQASPELKRIRNELRQKRQKLRGTLEQYTRGSASKYLQDEVITERNGRFVLMVRAEHRGNVPGIVHGTSTTGATLFLEPSATVEINNDIVELEDREREEILRILLELTDRFRARPAEMEITRHVASELDVLQAKARYSSTVNGVAPEFTIDTSLHLKSARHPMLERAIPVDVFLDPPNRVLLITGPNTGGKTVALKTAGLFALMAQSGLHLPAASARLPVFRSVFADIGDEQSIAESLSTFSAHIANVVAMDDALEPPCLVLLDEAGGGTDPNEGGALATAIIDHFRRRGAMVVATTHFDALKTYASTTDEVTSAGFGFNPETFAPTYRLHYGSPGSSLALEIATRLGLPGSIIAQARAQRTAREAQLADHLAKVEREMQGLDHERRLLAREHQMIEETQGRLQAREQELRGREETLRKRLDQKIEERLREAKREIDSVVDALKARTSSIAADADRRAARLVPTGDIGAARADARSAIDAVAGRLRETVESPAPPPADARPAATGDRVTVGSLGLEGIVQSVHDGHAEVDVRGKRMRARLADLRVVSTAATVAASPSRVRVNVELAPREGAVSTEINVIGANSEEAVGRVERFLDEASVNDLRSLRIIHGYGTGQLRRSIAEFLRAHPFVSTFGPAPDNQGGGGVTVVELKE